MSLRLTILGCHSATPRVNAFPTSQYLEINDRHFIIDCGEGTQRQMRKYKVGRLPVTDKSGKLKGMISVNNLLSHAITTKENIGDVSSKYETLAKTIKALFERNSTSKVKLAEKKPKIQLSDEYI